MYQCMSHIVTLHHNTPICQDKVQLFYVNHLNSSTKYKKFFGTLRSEMRIYFRMYHVKHGSQTRDETAKSSCLG